MSEARALEPNLVLMDIHLNGRMDGIEAAGIIKESCHVPVIYLTAYSDSDTLQKAKLTEPFGYVLKPFDERALEASIEMALHKASQQEELLRAKERLATVLHSIGDGIIVAGIKGTVEYINGTAAELLRLGLPLPPSTSIMRLLKLVTHRSRQEIPLPLDEVILNGKRAGYRNCILVTEQGTRRAVDLNLEPYRDEQDMVRGIVLAFRDVSEPRRIEGLVEEEIKAAVDVHKSLLPVNGTVAGRRPHARVPPARRPSAPGTSTTSTASTTRTRGVFIVDVMGHGMAAASMAHLVSRLLTPGPEGKHRCRSSASPPWLRGTRLSRHERALPRFRRRHVLHHLLRGDRPARRGSCAWCGAGHPFPRRVRADGAGGRNPDGRVRGGTLSPAGLVEAELTMQTRRSPVPLFRRPHRLHQPPVGAVLPGAAHHAPGRHAERVRLADAVARVAAEVAAWRGSRRLRRRYHPGGHRDGRGVRPGTPGERPAASTPPALRTSQSSAL